MRGDLNRVKFKIKSEQDIKNEILEYLAHHQIFAWPNDSTGIYDPIKGVYRKKMSKYFIRGTSDILGIYQGKLLAIEVKSKTGRLSIEQQKFLRTIAQEGGIAIMARSVEEVEEALTLCSSAYKCDSKAISNG